MELTTLEVLLAPEHSTVHINDVSLFVCQVAPLVAAATMHVHKALIRGLRHNAAVRVLLKDSHHVLDIKSLSCIVEQLVDVSIVRQLSSVELLVTINVDQVTVVALSHPAMFIDTMLLLVHEKALVGLHQFWLALCVIKVSHELMRVKIVLF